MKEDLKNVIITFGLIALVFTQGSLAYQKKIYREFVASVEQQKLEKNKNNELVKAEEQRLLKQQELIAEQIKESKLALQNAESQKKVENNLSAKIQADLAQQQAEAEAQAKILAAQKAAQILAQQQREAALAQAQAQAQKITSSRQSRAS